MILRAEKINFAYDHFRLENCSLDLKQGSCTFLIGPNGAGKTTLLKVLCGVLRPGNGVVQLDEKPLTSYRSHEIARRLAVVEQESRYVFPFTVEEVVMMGRFPHNPIGFFESAADVEATERALAITHMLPLRDRSIMTLSGGERRRVDIARALAQEAHLILLDEPTVFLDIRQQHDMMELLAALNNKGVTLLVISHDIDMVATYATDVYFMKAGSVRRIEKSVLHDRELVRSWY